MEDNFFFVFGWILFVSGASLHFLTVFVWKGLIVSLFGILVMIFGTCGKERKAL